MPKAKSSETVRAVARYERRPSPDSNPFVGSPLIGPRILQIVAEVKRDLSQRKLRTYAIEATPDGYRLIDVRK